jgi:hypothetical protein
MMTTASRTTPTTRSGQGLHGDDLGHQVECPQPGPGKVLPELPRSRPGPDLVRDEISGDPPLTRPPDTAGRRRR